MTKNNPSKFDCHVKAADDEPLFTLRAKDPIAPAMIEIWRQIRAGDRPLALEAVVKACADWDCEVYNDRRKNLPLNSEKSQEAKEVSASMYVWRVMTAEAD